MPINTPAIISSQSAGRFPAACLILLLIVLSLAACAPRPGESTPLEPTVTPLATGNRLEATEPAAGKPVSEPATPTQIPTVPPAAATASPPTATSPATQTLQPPATATVAEQPPATVLAPTQTAEPTAEPVLVATTIIGQSSLGNALTAYHFGQGERKIVVVGGIHGGYEWNTILLAWELVDYYSQNPEAVPDSITLTLIPAANPDGLERVAGTTGRFAETDLPQDTSPGRFNGNYVDLNRNWACAWQPTGTWRGREVNAGSSVFSEPESIALRDYFLQQRPAAVIFLHSALNGVYASGCPDTYQPSMELAQVYGEAANYPVYERFTAYEITGDAGDWLATQGITSISVELRNHEDRDRAKNFAGMEAVLNYYQ